MIIRCYIFRTYHDFLYNRGHRSACHEVFSCALMRAIIGIPQVTENRGLLRFCWCLALLLVWMIFNFMMIFEVRRAKEDVMEPSRASVHMPGGATQPRR